jgi:glycosyltransferase involved in cell wall biosynthesis
MSPCALFVANRGFGLSLNCRFVFPHLRASGWRIVIATADDERARALAADGATLEVVEFRRGRFDAKPDLRAFRRMSAIHRKHRPDLVHHFNAKPVLIGGLAALLFGRAKVVNTITGLGYAFAQPGVSRSLAAVGYRTLIPRSDFTIFQNPDDLGLFERERWVQRDAAALILGSGVDCNRFRPGGSRPADRPTVLMVTRLLWQKGVREFVEAARIVSRSFPEARIQLGGEWDRSHADGVDEGYVREAEARGDIEFLGYVSDMTRKLQETDIFVLPSYYGEGVPRVLLEAAASGVPAITADAPGCRVAVEHERSGLLVPPRDAAALAHAMLKLLRDRPLRARMAERSRALCVERFDLGIITREIVDVYRRAGADVPSFEPTPVR